ncbi:MAG TPA: hypothetical protein VHV55_20715 [Pirellulales bacterium]|nr:hypothetical protein [Pirellulales bacterium]
MPKLASAEKSAGASHAEAERLLARAKKVVIGLPVHLVNRDEAGVVAVESYLNCVRQIEVLHLYGNRRARKGNQVCPTETRSTENACFPCFGVSVL